MATEGRVVAAAIFWMKARAGWREKQVVEVEERRPLAQLSDAELLRIIEDVRNPPTQEEAEARWFREHGPGAEPAGALEHDDEVLSPTDQHQG